MRNKKLLKEINIWVYIIPFLVVIVLFSMGMYSSVSQKLKENYEHFKDDAVDAARSYSFSLKKSDEAATIIESLLDERLVAAGKTVMLVKKSFSQTAVKALADSLEVDQVCVYDSSGTIIYSNIDSYVGWKAESGHPVHDFIISGKDVSLDKIRADTISGEYYKYAYYKLASGEFVQIGISAMEVRKVLGDFEVGKIIDELNEDPDIDQISLINKEQIILESSKPETIGTRIDIPEAAAAVYEGKETGSIVRSGSNILYNSFIPLRRAGEIIGVLYVSSQEREAAYLAAIELKNSIWILAIVLLSTGGIVLMLYKNSRNYIRLAYYDQNTGLPNQESLLYFLDGLRKEEKWTGGIMMLNFSYLTNLSLLYGSDYAEKVFAEIAFKVKKIIENECTVFRTSRDRLIIYCENFVFGNETCFELNRISDLFKNVTFSDQNIYVPVEIGIAQLTEGEADPQKLLRKALIAMSRTKENGGVSYQYFNSEMEALIERENIIEKEILTSIKDEEDGKEGSVNAFFQPQTDAVTKKITGFEALARMKSGTLGNVSPAEFIGIAERKRLITPLTKLIIKKTSEFIRQMKETSGKAVHVAVNISGADLMRSDFIEDLTALVDNLGIEMSDLEFEITESLFMDDFAMSNEKLGFLRDAGALISLDDFGTGFSSLSRLRDLNVDIVKIDKMFIDNILVKNKDELIIPDIISMAHKVGLKVIAEGVETEAQRDYLVEAECDTIQGYLFSRPVKSSEALEMLLRE